MLTVRVELGERSYPIVVGAGVAREIAALLPDGVRRAVVVTQAAMRPFAESVPTGVETAVVEIGDGEQHKTLSTVAALHDAFVAHGVTRRDVVVGVGGGMVTDVAGFAAAVHLRGVAVVHVATTLVGMVDAAIGGKTGVNSPGGKNLIGAFWQPSAVVCDTDSLATLPPREWACGNGELAKYELLLGERWRALPLEERVANAAAYKARVVSLDEHERTGVRALLNYGHTLGHALEAAGHHELRHGEAVGIGLVFAARLAQRLGRIDAAAVDRHVDVVSGYELATEIPAGYDADELMAFMQRDKKAIDGLTFVLDGPGGIEVVSAVDDAVVRTLLKELVS
jgi:5-deoxy-5-amino-3-dehydroquinate synthase